MIRLLILFSMTFIACTKNGGKTSSFSGASVASNIPVLSDSLSIKDLNPSQLKSYVDNLVRNVEESKDSYDTLSIAYDCPNILDKGRLTVFKKEKDIEHIYHRFENGNQKSSIHKYYLLEGEMVLAEFMDGYWSFEIGSDERSQNVTTVNQIYFDGLNEKSCFEKKFIYTVGQDPLAESKNNKFQEASCSKAKVVLSKFRLIYSVLNNPKRENKPCIFY